MEKASSRCGVYVTSRTMDNVVSLVSRLQAACTVLGDHMGDGGPRSLPSLWERLPSIVVIGGQVNERDQVGSGTGGLSFFAIELNVAYGQSSEARVAMPSSLAIDHLGALGWWSVFLTHRQLR